jgi:hypothetical protein
MNYGWNKILMPRSVIPTDEYRGGTSLIGQWKETGFNVLQENIRRSPDRQVVLGHVSVGIFVIFFHLIDCSRSADANAWMLRDSHHVGKAFVRTWVFEEHHLRRYSFMNKTINCIRKNDFARFDT